MPRATNPISTSVTTSQSSYLPPSLPLTPIRSNASRVDPIQELTRLKHSVSLLETYILANHRPGIPHFKHPLENPIGPPGPKKEPLDTDTLEKDNAPGMVGSHGHGGFYTGATSAVTHLTLVLTFLFSILQPPT